MIHVVTVEPEQIPAILDGRQRVEIRFSDQPQHWHGHVRVGERVYFASPGHHAQATAIIQRVHTYQVHTEADHLALRMEFEHVTQRTPAFWQAAASAAWAVAVWIASPEKMTDGPSIAAQPGATPTTWVVLPDHLDVYPQGLAAFDACEGSGCFIDPRLEAGPTTSEPRSSQTAPPPPDAHTPPERRAA